MAKSPSDIKDPALRSWESLNQFVMGTEDEASLRKLLAVEMRGRKRRVFVQRIHSRLAKLRINRERRELEERLS